MTTKEGFRFEPISERLSNMAGFLVRNYNGNVTPIDILGMNQHRPMLWPVLLTRRLAQTAPPSYTLAIYNPLLQTPLRSVDTWLSGIPEGESLNPAQRNTFQREIQEGLLRREDTNFSFSQQVPQLLTEQPQLNSVEVQA